MVSGLSRAQICLQLESTVQPLVYTIAQCRLVQLLDQGRESFNPTAAEPEIPAPPPARRNGVRLGRD